MPNRAFLTLLALTALPCAAQTGTINPDNYAPGTNVSYVTPGVVLKTLTLEPIMHGLGESTFASVLSSVYVDGNVFAFSKTGANEWGIDPANSGTEVAEPICLHGCFGPNGWSGFTFLDVHFNRPVSLAGVVQYVAESNVSGCF